MNVRDHVFCVDYRFLEETGRVADGPNRDTLLHTRTRHSYSVSVCVYIHVCVLLCVHVCMHLCFCVFVCFI